MRLEDYPRPKDDTGLGIHFGQDLRRISLDTYIPKMLELQMKWCLIPHQDELQLQTAAQAIWAAGIMPISRWVCRIDQSVLDFKRLVDILRQLGVPPYIQIFNEPGDPREWKSSDPDFDQFVLRWARHASVVATAGGFPGLQLLDPNEVRAVLRYLTRGGAASAGANVSAILERMWFCPHPYGANHPPDYPYDVKNQKDHPGSTVFQDDIATLAFLEFAPVFREEIGVIPPFIAGEGGWQYRNAEDSRYPPVDDALHAQYHLKLLSSFARGKLANGDELPDYLFAFCPWILFGGEADAWYSWTTGTRLQTINAIKSIPPFVREFNWESAPPPRAKTIRHYLLFGPPSTHVTRSTLIGATKYITTFGPTVGFDAAAAENAQNVTIIGDVRAVVPSIEAHLIEAGCHVERLNGDQYRVDAILAERAAKGAEFG